MVGQKDLGGSTFNSRRGSGVEVTKHIVTHDRERGITTVELKSAHRYADIQKILRDDVEREALRNVIWIINEGSVSDLTTDDLKSSVVTRMDVFESRRGGTTVLVARGGAEQYLLKWFATYATSVAKVPIHVVFCGTLAEAIAEIEANERTVAVGGSGLA